MPWVARALWAAVSVALAVLLVWAAIAMPDRVPMKLDAAGYPGSAVRRPVCLRRLPSLRRVCWAMGPLARDVSRSTSLDLINVPFHEPLAVGPPERTLRMPWEALPGAVAGVVALLRLIVVMVAVRYRRPPASGRHAHQG